MAGAGGGSNGEAYYNNFMIPFGKSIVVTVQHLGGEFGGFYMARHYSSVSRGDGTQIVRGMLNKPLDINGIVLPQTARLKLQVVRVSQTLRNFPHVS